MSDAKSFKAKLPSILPQLEAGFETGLFSTNHNGIANVSPIGASPSEDTLLTCIMHLLRLKKREQLWLIVHMEWAWDIIRIFHEIASYRTEDIEAGFPCLEFNFPDGVKTNVVWKDVNDKNALSWFLVDDQFCGDWEDVYGSKGDGTDFTK